MAQAIIQALRAARSDVQIAFTFFSPSAERIAPRVGADVTSYLPWDVTSEIARVLDALQPTVVAFVRTEIWPVLTREAKRRAIALALINAVLAEDSSRLRPAAKLLLRSAYARLDRVGAVTEADAHRLVRLGVEQRCVHVTGDARFDQVSQRVRRLDRGSALLRALGSSAPLVVAGSTWAPDEDRLVPAFTRLRARMAVRLLVAPHEPTPDHLERLEAALFVAGLDHERLSAVEQRGSGSAAVTVVDRVGVLADLYAIGSVAYVGGGFGRAGLHSVVEPAALGVPVLCGPRHGNAEEAVELTRAGGAFVVWDADGIAEHLTNLLTDSDAHAIASAAATQFVHSRLGGAPRNAQLLLELASR